MSETIREQIIAAFTDRAAALSNLPVQRVQRSVGETKERFISVWDGADQVEEIIYGIERSRFAINLECIWQHGTDNPSTSANELIGEIITTMIGPTVDKTFGGLATDITRQSATPEYPESGSEYTTTSVVFIVSYATLAGDPYTLPTD